VVLIPKATLVLVFVVMAVVLVLRPNGLLGRAGAPTLPAGAARAVRPPTRGQMFGWAALLLLALAAPLLAGPYLLSILTEALVAVLFAASLHFIMGPGGMPSFGHAAWFGIGAYAAGLSAQWLGAPMPLGLALAPLAAAAVAALFGTLVVRLSGVYLAMLTLAFAQIVWAMAFQWVGVTGGDNGILGIWPPAWASGPVGFYLLALLLCAGGAAGLQRVLYARFGYALRAARDSVLRAEAIGLDTQRIRLVAFTLAGAAAGLAGAVFTYMKGSVFPGYVSIPRSVDALLMVLLGGVQTMAGPVVGALAYTGLYDGLLRVTELWRLVLGLVIVGLVVAFPEGIAGAWPGRRA
jgi:branched-chain amino acid transport system permease protein